MPAEHPAAERGQRGAERVGRLGTYRGAEAVVRHELDFISAKSTACAQRFILLEQRTSAKHRLADGHETLAERTGCWLLAIVVETDPPFGLIDGVVALMTSQKHARAVAQMGVVGDVDQELV